VSLIVKQQGHAALNMMLRAYGDGADTETRSAATGRGSADLQTRSTRCWQRACRRPGASGLEGLDVRAARRGDTQALAATRRKSIRGAGPGAAAAAPRNCLRPAAMVPWLRGWPARARSRRWPSGERPALANEGARRRSPASARSGSPGQAGDQAPALAYGASSLDGRFRHASA
jgi:hypothetical protein